MPWTTTRSASHGSRVAVAACLPCCLVAALLLLLRLLVRATAC
jgi:hypothetical protein